MLHGQHCRDAGAFRHRTRASLFQTYRKDPDAAGGDMLSFMELTNLNLCWKELAQENVFTCKKGYRFPSRHDLLYFILRGRVRLAALTPEGEEKNIWYLREGCFFNETPAFLQAAPVLQGTPAPCLSQWPPSYPTAVSAFHECTEVSLLGSLSFDRVRKVGLYRPEMLLNLCQSFSLKVSLLAQNMASFTLETPRRRVYKYLATRIEPGSNPPRIQRTMSYMELANLLGMHRISLYKIFNEAQKSGILAFDKKNNAVIVLQPDAFFRNAGL